MTPDAQGFSKRQLGLWLAGFILVALLALPLLSYLSPAFDEWQAHSSFKMGKWMSPGALTAGHELNGTQCSTCHQRTFESVADTACTNCHQRMAMHVVNDHSHVSAVNAARCVDCHSMHQDKAEAVRDGSSQCVGCHKNLGTSTGTATDFAAAHPEFSLSLIRDADTVSVKLDGNSLPPEKPGLKFSHQRHLSPKGISTPDGDTVMNCQSCHHLEASGKHFAPMTMKLTCQQSRCHTLRFDEPIYGVVTHGSERDAMNKIRNFYLKQLVESPTKGGQQCASAPRSGTALQRSLDCADSLARKHAGGSLFKTTGTTLKCALCHEIKETGAMDMPWEVSSVRFQYDWQPKATFDHGRHSTMKCTKCHDKQASTTSEDVSFPRIGLCRECHAGNTASAGKFKSNCAGCHQFHRVAASPAQ